MATRRVKRIKRSKKHVHRARGRKTKRHNRITRRHQGGMFKGIMKALFTKKINPKGGELYDGIEVFSPEDDMYHIGSRRLDEYKSVDDKQYAEKIIFYLNKASIPLTDPTGMVILNQADFDKFAKASQLKDFVPRAAAASVASAAPVAEKPDSNKIFIQSTGVQFGAIFKPWRGSNTCEFSNDKNPCFTQYVFTKNENPKLVNVKYVMPSMDAKTYCALAAYETNKLSYLTTRFDYGLISPGVTVEFGLQEQGEITSSFVATGIQLNAHYNSCNEPYDDDLYTFYQEQDHNSLVATMFFEKPEKVEWSNEVYIRQIKQHIADGKKDANNPIFPEQQKLIMIAQLNDFERRLNALTALTAKPDSNGLKQLDSEVTDYIRTGFQTSLFHAKRNKASLAAQMKRVSVSVPGAAAARP
jgi:hypothetical protein